MSLSREVVASASRTATGNSGAIDLERRSGENLALLVDVTAATGTSPTMDLEVEWSADGTTFGPAETADTFTQITDTGAVVKRFDVKASQYRIVWTLAGTSPDFTFSIHETLT